MQPAAPTIGVIALHVPGPPGVESPLLWGTEQHLAGGTSSIHGQRRYGTGGSPGTAMKMENRSKLASCTGYPM